MPRVKVNKLKTADCRSSPVFKELRSIADVVRQRAYEIFQRRGFGDGHAVDDWLAAERQICWPTGELEEADDAFELTIAMAGFEPAEIDVTATPSELIVKAHHEHAAKKADKRTVWTEFHRDIVLRRVALPAEIDTARVTANYKRGLLKIEAPKAAATPSRRAKTPAPRAARKKAKKKKKRTVKVKAKPD